MKQLSYDGGTWLLGDEAADALLDYAVSLGRRSGADSIEVSVLDGDGQPEQLTLLIGPATMMTAGTSRSRASEPDNRDAIAEMTRRLHAAVPPGPVTSPQPIINDYIEDF